MQEAAVSTAGYDLTDISSFTRDQWGMVCPQFKMLLAQPESVANIKKYCSPKLGNMFETVKAKCSTSASVDKNSGMSQDQSKAMKTAMCQGISTMVSEF